ncbi:MAG TPA: NAD-dependent epimerase/dehydratase family protein [Thermoanaerobaculia bacterium]|nr:NAD-dependent epimerase/dehydratase family protein [Thermoanaerobaculia bacterium]
MKILITGGTGFLGRRLVAELAPRHQLRLLVRQRPAPPPPRAAAPQASQAPQAPLAQTLPGAIETVAGDVTDLASLRSASTGCEAVVHAAALVKILAPAAEFDRINLGGFDNILAAAAEAGVRKLVYVSSFIALGPTEAAPGGVLDEAAPAETREWINDYERTKTLADGRARRAIAAGAPLNVVYPGVIYGPGELTEGNLVVRHLLDLLHSRLPALIGSSARRWSYVYVDDVVHGIAQVLERAATGARYVLGGDNVTLGEFYATVERLSGVKVPRRRMPDGLAKAAGALQKGWARLRGTTPQLTPDLVEIYRHDWAYSSARAAAELGYQFRPLAEGLASTLDWLRESGRWQGG